MRALLSIPSLSYVGLAVLLGLLAVGCLGHENSTTSGDRQSALDKATKVIKDAGYPPANFAHQESYDTNSGRWTVVFQPTAKPRPPGGDLIVWVNLATGETKLLHGQ